MIDWILVIPVAVFAIFALGYLVAEKKHTGDKWMDIFF